MKGKIKLDLNPEEAEELKQLTGGERALASIGFIKRYTAMNEKPGMKEKAKSLLDQINHAFEKGRITDNDPYITEIDELKKNHKGFITCLFYLNPLLFARKRSSIRWHLSIPEPSLKALVYVITA